MCVRKRKCDKLEVYAEGKDEIRRRRRMGEGLERQAAYRVQYAVLAKLESGELMRAVMAMRVSKMNHFALTVSADHLIGRYDLKARHVSSLWRSTWIAYRMSLLIRKRAAGSSEHSILGMGV